MWIDQAAAAALIAVGSTAGTAPAPLVVQPLLIVPSNDARAQAMLIAAVQRLVKEGYLKADTKRLKHVRVSAECIKSAECVAARKQLTRHGRDVAVVAYNPAWRSADYEVRCVGSDPLRQYTARINLRDAAHGSSTGARPQLKKLGSCIVDMKLPPGRAE
jgi:hypothetical protein